MSRHHLIGAFLAVAVWPVVPLVPCLAAPPEASSSSAPQFQVDSYQLDNGLRVALSHDPGAPRTTLCVAYHVGSKNERPGLTGFAHFFEHMMFRGTQNVPNFDIPLQQAGGSPNAFTSEDVTVYFETVPNAYVKRALYMEAERMAFLSSDLNQQKFDTEREVVKNERRQRMENVPYGLADETLIRHVHPPGHPYSWSVIGSMRDLNNATLEDLRQFFLEFYHPGNATLTLVGGFDAPAAKQWIETYFGPIAPGPEVAPMEVPSLKRESARIIQQDRVQFPRVYWAWPAVGESDPDAPALDLLAMILSDGDASRLEQALVKQTQVAVEADATSQTGEIGGLFKIAATVAPGQSVADVEAQLKTTLDQLRHSGVSDAEMKRVKAKYRTDLLVGLTSPMQRAIVIGLGLVQHDDPHYYRVLFQRYEAVTAEDIERVAAQYLPPEKVTLVIEPVESGEAESEAVLAGPLPGEGDRAMLEPREHASGPDWSKMPAPTAPRPFAPPTFERHTLDNGLEVWLANWRTLPIVSARLLVRAGSADAAAAQAGLADLTAELWDQGTRDQTAREFAEAVDALGTSIRVMAGTNTTQLGFTVESRSFDELVELVSQMVLAPRFAEEDFARERKLQLSALARGSDSASWIAGRVFPTLLFGAGHPYAIAGQGYPQTVEGLKVQHVRQFYQEHFTPANSVRVMVGDFQTGAALKRLEQRLGSWQGQATVRDVPENQRTSRSGMVYLVDKPGAVQSVIAVGRPWKDRRDPSYFAARLGNRIFGGDFLSRLNQNLRQRNGFTYGVRSGFQFYEDRGNWNVITSVRAEVTGAALREIVREMNDARASRPITPQEVAVARSAEMSLFPRSFETPASIASTLAQLAIYRLPDDYYQDYLDRLRKTDASDTTRVVAEVVDPEQLRILVVGDREVVVPTLQEAGFQEVVSLDIDGRPSSP